MRNLVLALLIALCAASAQAESRAAGEPDFHWGAKCSRAVNTALAHASVYWDAAAVVPPKSPRSPTRLFDEAYLREQLGTPDGSAYSLLDTAMRRLKLLDECRTLYMKAVALRAGCAPDMAKEFDDCYYLLASRIRLAIGLARASIARQMTAPISSNYCFQAMETAIDALRDAADDAAKVPNGTKRAESIRKLRSALFDAWDRAQRSKDTSLIGQIELTKAFDESGLLDDSRTQSRL